MHNILFVFFLVRTCLYWLSQMLNTYGQPPHFIKCVFQSDSVYPSKKSRLPVPLKSSRSLGNIPLASCTHKPDMHLQHRIMAVDEGLKESKMQNDQLQQQTTRDKELSLSKSLIENFQETPLEQKRASVRGK